MNEKLKFIARTVNGILWEADANTFEFTYVSPKSQEILGYSPEQWYESKSFWKDHIHPEDREYAVSFCHNKTTERLDHEFEYRMIDTNGKIVRIRDYVTVEEKEGKFMLSGLMLDITKCQQISIERAETIQKSYQLAGIGNWQYDIEKEELFWSQEVKNLHEVGPDFIPDLESAISFYPKESDRQKIQEAVDATIKTGKAYDLELQIKTAKGNHRWIRTAGDTKSKNGKCTLLYGIKQDITLQKENEREIKKLSRVARETHNMVIITDAHQRIQWVNKAFERISGYTQEEVLGKDPGKLLQGKDTDPDMVQRIHQKVKAKQPFTDRILNYSKQGRPYWVQMSVNPLSDEQGRLTGYFSIQEDVTEMINSQNRNQVLLQEIHHRVKNNLAIISGMLTLEMEEFENDRAKLSFQRSINRIQSIAKVHELLYGNDDLSVLNLSNYLSELTSITHLTFAYDQNIKVELEIADVEMNINSAVPFGMLMNELLTNSFKYAFEGKDGVIFINVEQDQTGYRVIYRDTGRGMKKKPDLKNSTTLGFTIIHTLLDQLNASYTLDVKDQFELTFSFKGKNKGSHSNLIA